MQTQLDFTQASDARDLGISLAEDKANLDHPNLTELALIQLRCFLLENKGEFQMEDVREFAYKNGLQQAESNRSWGAVAVKARKLGLIQFVRIEPTRGITAHRANANVYIGRR